MFNTFVVGSIVVVVVIVVVVGAFVPVPVIPCRFHHCKCSCHASAQRDRKVRKSFIGFHFESESFPYLKMYIYAYVFTSLYCLFFICVGSRNFLFGAISKKFRTKPVLKLFFFTIPLRHIQKHLMLCIVRELFRSILSI